MLNRIREMGNCLTSSGLSLIVVGGGLVIYACKNSSIHLTKAIWCPDLFNNEPNSDEGKRLLETEAEQQRLEQQRKHNEEQLRRKMQELDSASFINDFILKFLGATCNLFIKSRLSIRVEVVLPLDASGRGSL